MLNDLESLPNGPVELQGMVTLLAKEVKSQALFIEKLQHQLHGADRHRFGSTSESLDQLQLFDENEEIATAAAVEIFTRLKNQPETMLEIAKEARLISRSGMTRFRFL